MDDVIPAVEAGRLFMLDTDRVLAFDAATGTGLWTQPVTNGAFRLLAAEGRVYVTAKQLHAFDAATGRALWTFTPAASLDYVQAETAPGRVFTGSRTNGTLYAIDAATGRVVWQRVVQQPGWPFPADLQGISLHEGTLYVIADRPYNENTFYQATVIVALDPATGEEKWRYQDGDETTHRSASGNVSFYQNLILYGDLYEGFVAALDRTTRQQVWRWKTPPGYTGAWQAPTVDGERAYVAPGDGNAYALDAATGRVLWKGRGQGSYRSQAVCGHYVLATFTTVEAFEKESGRFVKTVLGKQALVSSQVLSAGERMFVAAKDGVYAFDCTR